ncbi:MAG: YgfZ/GcvT domain-containing protein [Acidimicrobiales bacterium]
MTAGTGYDELRTSAAARLLARDVVRVYGSDAGTYLQGQCSQDVLGLEPGAGLEALLLSPQGKVDAYLRVTSVGSDGFVLDTDPGYGEVVTARLERFRLRVDVEIESLDWRCVAVRGPQASGAVVGRPELVLPVAWPGLVGVDLLGPGADADAARWVDGAVAWCDDEAWEAARIETGVPVNGREILDGTIAAEVGLVDRTVSLTKGCFTGQELVARLDARGSKVARRLCGVVLGPDEGGTVLEAGSLVGASVLTEGGDHELGRLSSAARSPRTGGVVALVTLHRRLTPPAGVLVVAAADRISAEARPLPLVGPAAPPAGSAPVGRERRW